MDTFNRFEIWYAELPTLEDSSVIRGRRPVILISNNAANTYSSVVTVIPITSRICKQQLPTHVFLSGFGLAKSSIALCEQVMAVDKARLIKKIGYVTDRFTQLQIAHALKIQMGLEPLLRPAA